MKKGSREREMQSNDGAGEKSSKRTTLLELGNVEDRKRFDWCAEGK